MRLYATILAAIVSLIAFEAWIQSRPVVEEMRTELSALETRQLDTYMETTKLLTTLATAVIGAATGFLLNRREKVKLTDAHKRRVLFSWILASASLYCGHLAYQNVIWMLNSKFFNLFYPGIAWPTRAQFWLFLLAVITLADFVYRSIAPEGEVS